MKAFRRVLWALLGTAILATNVAASYTAAPAKSDPQKLRWKGESIRIAISSSLIERSQAIKAGSDVDGAILRSLALWREAIGVEFVIENTDIRNVSPSGVAGDGVSLITIAASPENVQLFAKDPYSESARTRVFFDRKGFITESDIVLNPYQQFSTDGTVGTFDLEATLAHEIGHLLGLRHSSVLGSVMSEGLFRNDGSIPQYQTPVLSDSDIAAIRDLYGFEDDEGTCCAAIGGKLVQPAGKAQRSFRVWAEQNNNGRVAAQSDSLADGTYRLGGLPPGVYSVFWQMLGEAGPSPIGQLGTVKLAAGDSRVLNSKVEFSPSGQGLSFVGLNSQMTDSAVTIGNEREYVIYLGGTQLDRGNLRIEFNSPYFRAVPGTVKRHDFGSDLSAVSFVLSVEPNVPRGVYSLFLTGDDGILAALVGGLRVVGETQQ